MPPKDRALRFHQVLLTLAKAGHAHLDTYLKKATSLDAQALEVERVSVWFFSRDHSEILCENLFERDRKKHSRGLVLKARQYPHYFRALDKSRTIAADNARTDPRTREFTKTYLKPLGITSMMDVPIRHHGRVAGILCHEHKGPKRRWSMEEQDFAASVADTISLALEISHSRRADLAFRQADERYRTIAANAPIILYAMDAQGVFTLLEGKGLEGVGLKPGQLVGQSIYELYKDDAKVLRNVRRVMAGETLDESIEVKMGPGAGHVFEFNFTPVRDGRRRVIGATGVATDITARKQAEEKLQYMAYHDGLTGLPNRLLFEDRLNLTLANARRSGELVALMLIDLDNFKTINDTLGHGAGDKVLQEVAQRMTAHLRDGDTVARLGGDEFIFLLPQIRKTNNVLSIADRLFAALKAPVRLGKRKIPVSTSMGMALFPADGSDAKTLLKNVDSALYRAKEAGKNNFQFYRPY